MDELDEITPHEAIEDLLGLLNRVGSHIGLFDLHESLAMRRIEDALKKAIPND